LQQEDSGPTIHRQPSFKWAQDVGKGQKSPTKTEALDSPHPSPQRAEHDMSIYGKPGTPAIQQPTGADKPRSSAADGPSTSGQRPGRQESSDNLKSFKVSLDDPTWKVLPAALKKYRINNDNWQNYAMFICYGTPGTSES